MRIDSELQAGVARVDITPPAGVPQGGWGAQIHQRAAGIDMPLYATALVLRQDETVVAIVDADLINFDDDQVRTIQSEISNLSGIAREHIRVSATHSHSGPNYFRAALVTEGLDLLEAYMGALPKRIAGGVWEAKSRLQPVRIGFGAGRCPIAVNRRAAVGSRVVVGRNENGPGRFGFFFRLRFENGAACRFNARNASSSSLRNRSISACAVSSCFRRD